MRDVFPLPVRPTTPSFSPPLTVNVKPLSTRGESARYLSWNCRHNDQTKNQLAHEKESRLKSAH
jgi:hypothetical protein